MRSLIIRGCWIDEILAGRKTWELRPGRVRFRDEAIALIPAGSGSVAGTVVIREVLGPMSLAELSRASQQRKHRVPPAELAAFLTKWENNAYAWVFTDPQPLPRPIPFKPKRGTQTWVKRLPPHIVRAIDELAYPDLHKRCA